MYVNEKKFDKNKTKERIEVTVESLQSLRRNKSRRRWFYVGKNHRKNSTLIKKSSDEYFIQQFQKSSKKNKHWEMFISKNTKNFSFRLMKQNFSQTFQYRYETELMKSQWSFEHKVY